MVEIDERMRALHSDMARLQVEMTKARLRALSAATGEPVPDSVQRSIAAESTEYQPVETTFGGLFFMVIDTTINYEGNSYAFKGMGGGLGFGAAVSWGAAWLNYPLETLDGWDFRFEANLGLSVVNINWWGMSGENIGSFVGAGIALAAGVFGGSGSISKL